MTSGPDIHSTFDLQNCTKTILRHWYFVVIFAILAALGVLCYSLIQPASFTAVSDVSLLDVRSEVVFAPDFRTVPNSDSSNMADPENRSKALTAMAQNTSLLIQVYEQLPDDEKEETSFTDFIKSTNVRNTGDLLRFEVTWTNPNTAAEIVNSWTKLYVQLANSSYINSARTYEEAKITADDAFEQYADSQQALEEFLAQSQLRDLQRTAGEIDILLGKLEEQKADALQFQVGSHFLDANHLMNLARDAYIEHIDYTIQRQKEYQQGQLDRWYRRLSALKSEENHYRDLQRQFSKASQTPSAKAGDALAMMYARSGMSGNLQLPDLLLQVDITQLASSATMTTGVKDMHAMLEANQQEQIEANAQIAAWSNSLFTGSDLTIPEKLPEDNKLIETINKGVENIFQIDPTEELSKGNYDNQPLSLAIEELAKHRNELTSQIEALQSTQKVLERTRDADWNLFVTLDNKAKEIKAQSSIGAPQVRLAIQAEVPLEANDRYLGIKMLLALIFGAILGMIFAIIFDAWQPLFQSRG